MTPHKALVLDHETWCMIASSLWRCQKNTSLIGFADDTIIVYYNGDVNLLEQMVNDILALVKRWLEGRHLQITVQKTDTVLVTDRRRFRYPRIVLDRKEIS